MKVKNDLIFAMIFISIILVACTEQARVDPLERDIADTTEEELVTILSPVDIPSTIPHLIIDFENARSISVIDLLSNEELSRFILDDDLVVRGAFSFNNGYFALLVGKENRQDGRIDLSINEQLRYLILDYSLNLIAELFITDDGLQRSFYHFGSDVFYENNQFVVYYVTDWMEAEINGENQSIRRYNVHTGQTDILFEMDDNELSINRIRKVTEEIIAFTANRLSDEVNLHYGFIDFQTGEMTVFYEAFNLSYRNLAILAPYVLLAESLTAPTMGERRVIDAVERGEVIVINVETGQRHHIDLPSIESIWAILSKDGQHVVTAYENANLFRKYDIETGDLVFEQLFEFKGDTLDELIPISSNVYLVRSSNCNSDGTFYRELLTFLEEDRR